jgi:hypothetical protein
MKTISFRVSDSEALRLRMKAKEAGTSLSQFLRTALQGEASASPYPALTVCRHTGALIFAGRPEYPKLSTSYVRELLAEFP